MSELYSLSACVSIHSHKPDTPNSRSRNSSNSTHSATIIGKTYNQFSAFHLPLFAIFFGVSSNFDASLHLTLSAALGCKNSFVNSQIFCVSLLQKFNNSSDWIKTKCWAVAALLYDKKNSLWKIVCGLFKCRQIHRFSRIYWFLFFFTRYFIC